MDERTAGTAGDDRTAGIDPDHEKGGAGDARARARRAAEAALATIPEAERSPAVLAALDRLEGNLGEALRLADLDPLAPIANRRAFVRALTRLIAFSGRHDMAASLLYLDVNGFKQVNDAFGHNAGDAALTHVAGILLGNVRGSDVVGRLGGDEFGVLLAAADAAAAAEKAARLTEAIRAAPFVWQGRAMPLAVAVGVAPVRPGRDAADIIAEADRAMYADKRRLRAEAGASGDDVGQ